AGGQLPRAGAPGGGTTRPARHGRPRRAACAAGAGAGRRIRRERVNPLSLLNHAARAGGMKDSDSYGQREDNTSEPSAQDSAFARMLNTPSAPDPATQPKPKASAPASRRDTGNPPSDDEGQDQDTAAKTE